MKKGAIYARVSTADQASEDRVSLQRQIDECRHLADRHGYQIDSTLIFSEQVSGAADHRPVFNRMKAAAQEGRFQRLYVWDQTRLSRAGMLASLQIVDELDGYGVEVVTVEDGSRLDELLVGIKGWMAGKERERILQRTLPAKLAKRDAGKWVMGVAPYGYAIDRERKVLVVCQHEARTVRRMFELAFDGLGQTAIARTLNEEGYPPPEIQIPTGEKSAKGEPRYLRHRVGHLGGPAGLQLFLKEKGIGSDAVQHFAWQKSSVSKVLSSEVLHGVHVVRERLPHQPPGQRATGPELRRIQLHIEPGPIVTEAEWKRVQELTESRDIGKRGPSRVYLLSGKMVCGSCGSSYAHCRTGIQHSYACRARRTGKPCRSPSINAYGANLAVIQECAAVVRRLIPDTSDVRRFLDEQARTTVADLRIKLADVQRRRTEAEEAWRRSQSDIQRLIRLGAEDQDIKIIVSAAKADRQKFDELEKQEAALNNDIGQISSGLTAQEGEIERIFQTVTRSFDLVRDAGAEDREVLTDLRFVINELVDHVVVAPDRKISIRMRDLSRPERALAAALSIIRKFASEAILDIRTEQRITEAVKGSLAVASKEGAASSGCAGR